MRRPHRNNANRHNSDSNGHDINSIHDQPSQENSSTFLFSSKTLIPFSCLLVAICIGYKGYLETRINTPFDKTKIVHRTGLAVPDRYWGSYRPNVYFGMKTREPHSLITGIMWFFPESVRTLDDVRHWCEQKDYLKGYSWVKHDGKNFGIQLINDGNYRIKTSFVKKLKGSYGGDWTARISFESNDRNSNSKPEIFAIIYAAIDNQTKGYLNPTAKNLVGISGKTESLDNFEITLRNNTRGGFKDTYVHVYCSDLDVIKECIFRWLNISPDRSGRIASYTAEPPTTKSSEVVASGLLFRPPFEFDVNFESGSVVRRESLTGQFYDQELEKHEKLFDDKFENVFELRKKGFSEEQIQFAEAAFSNLIGGIGYFYGSSRVQSEHTGSPVPYWKAALYTAVPSRSFFPRGFLWDEGFHAFLIAAWDLDIVLDIIGHWFDLMNVEGWIPREQILGAEALKKVPAEFVTQVNTNANPPVFFLTLQFILQNYEEQLIEQSSRLETLDRLYKRLVAWYDWFNTTQTGPLPGTYRWRGRDPNITTELNPKTLTSGMDDYPRASHPTEDERHVDLRCWMAVSASALVTISNLLNKPAKRLVDAEIYLKDNALLDRYHWSERKEAYADYGLHTDRIILGFETERRLPVSADDRLVLKQPTLQLVDSTFGYNSLFPLMLRILEPDSQKLGKILHKLRDPDLLWTPYGLRSLAKKSPLYMKRNTKTDPPYWRGNIWINMNYLIVSGLYHYSKLAGGPYAQLAREIYVELRRNVIDNIFKEYRRTGYLWENYNDATGHGSGARPFTGWTSLVVLLMAEIY